MPSYVPPKRAAEYIFYPTFWDSAGAPVEPPTIVAGDVTVSTDGGAFANLATTPVVEPAGSNQAKVTVSIAEMTGDNITVEFVDQAGAQWESFSYHIQTAAETFDELYLVSFPAGSIAYTYTLTDITTGLPINGARIWVSTDIAGSAIIWRGNTDVFGIARDAFNSLPLLNAGTYYFWRSAPNYIFDPPYDIEVVS